ncbi:DUF1178 family protein [Erythrobacter litoralis]|uniref:Uncharacterized protein n=1 Tax=Erythrobacter litoralis (strain HTCC2594) TaxID=314225 RepID=Q2NAB1_ERYLH|nr:DUF1178 family protein [Erythrobacter litoralis]ABC63380.1 hypothetical protein ELI_06440 [Erythrobacter litoralis HTCC2594]
MIVYDLSCSSSHRFEVWFRSSADFAEQREKGWLQCPECGCEQVDKAPMAPSVPAKSSARSEALSNAPAQEIVSGGESAIPPKVMEAMKALAKAQSEAIKESKWVGKDFAQQARDMHYGEKDEELIHGKATPEEAQDLVDEGIAVAPLLVPVADPDELN